MSKRVKKTKHVHTDKYGRESAIHQAENVREGYGKEALPPKESPKKSQHRQSVELTKKR